MPKITAIKSQKRLNRLSIFIDGEFFVGTPASLVLMHTDYVVGKELSNEQLESLSNEVEYFEAREYAINLLSQREYSPKEIENKLRQREWLTHAKRIIDYLIERNFINIERYTLAFVRDKAKLKGWGPTRIKNEIVQKKGIPAERVLPVLEDYFAEHSVDDAALKYALKKSKRLDLSNRKDLNKLWNTMMRHGFTSEHIKTAITRLNENMEDDFNMEIHE